MNDKIDIKLNESIVSNRDNNEMKANPRDGDICTDFDDISLCDNNSPVDEMVEQNCGNSEDNCDTDLTPNEIISDNLVKTEDKLSMDLTSKETSIHGSTADEEELISNDLDLSDSEIVYELKAKNGIKLDVKAIEEKYEKLIIILQKERNDLQNGMEDMRRQLKEKELTFNDMKSRLSLNLERIERQKESTKRELEGMVIKYATNEKEVILLKRVRDDYDRKLKDALKDKDGLRNRIKGLSTEKSQLMSALDKKVVEISQIQREFDKLKDELKDRDQKWKQSMTKLNEEVSAHRETKSKLESTDQKSVELKAEAEGLRQELHYLLNRSNESEGSDKLSKCDNENDLSKMEFLSNESENYKRKVSVYEEENNCLTAKVQTLERERLDYEQSVSKWKQSANELEMRLSDNVLKLRDCEQLRLELDKQKQLVSDLHKEIDRLKASNNELRAEMESCRHKEGELLEFTERLTAKTVNLQSEHNLLEQKSSLYREDVERLQTQCEDLSKKNSSLSQSLDELKDLHRKEVQLLAKKLAEKTKLSEELKVRVDELENEIRVNKRRHMSSVKELNKELVSMRKRFEHIEVGSNHIQTDCVSIGSRTSSSNSLTDALSASNNLSSSHTSNTSQSSQPKPSASITQTNCNDWTNCSIPSVALLPEVDKQALIDRIIRLQKSLEKKSEKIDLFEELNQQLIHEMKKKSKLIQYYVLREESGALSTSSMDDHKRQLAKRGTGIMSSLYNSAPNDVNMTLELSLEINKKLQAVLEDTLLKNITLKENLNTLGAEIERLSKEKN